MSNLSKHNLGDSPTSERGIRVGQPDTEPNPPLPRDIPPAWDVAVQVCREWLAVTDGTTERGMMRIGSERFERWALKVEAALERANPKEPTDAERDALAQREKKISDLSYEAAVAIIAVEIADTSGRKSHDASIHAALAARDERVRQELYVALMDWLNRRSLEEESSRTVPRDHFIIRNENLRIVEGRSDYAKAYQKVGEWWSERIAELEAATKAQK